MNRPTNECIIEKYLNHYNHSKQSKKMREASLNYFFGIKDENGEWEKIFDKNGDLLGNKKYFGHEGHIFDINTQILIDYHDYLKILNSVSITTRRNKWNILTSFLKFTMEYFRDHNFIVIIPSRTISWNGATTKKTPINTNRKIIATIEEIQKILDHYKTHNYKLYLIFRLFIETGMRRGELIKTKISELNINERYINSHEGKTGEKYYFFSENLAKHLKIYLNERNKIETQTDSLFLNKHFNKYSDRGFNDSLVNTRNRLGFPKDRKISCKTFRKTINDMRKEMECPNEDRKILLGHKVQDVNVKSYTNSDFKRLRNLFDKWNPYKNIQF